MNDQTIDKERQTRRNKFLNGLYFHSSVRIGKKFYKFRFEKNLSEEKTNRNLQRFSPGVKVPKQKKKAWDSNSSPSGQAVLTS